MSNNSDPAHSVGSALGMPDALTRRANSTSSHEIMQSCGDANNGSKKGLFFAEQVLNNLPEEMRSQDHWLGWTKGKKKPNGKHEKPAVCLKSNDEKVGRWCDGTTGRYATDLADALSLVDKYQVRGLGYVLGGGDHIVLIDLDDCFDATTGEISSWALEILEDFQDTYVEISPSGSGLHILCFGHMPAGYSGGNKGKVEVYDSGRYTTITGQVLKNPGILVEKQEALQRLLDGYGFQSAESGALKSPSSKRTLSPTPGSLKESRRNGIRNEDRQIVNNVCAWSLGARLYGRAEWTGRYESQSHADLALMGLMLRFVDQEDEQNAIDQIVRIFLGSALAQTLNRKTNHEDDYLYRTARLAYANRHKYSSLIRDGDLHSREKRLQACTALLEQTLLLPWNKRGGATDFAVRLTLILRAILSGRIYGDEVRVRVSMRSLALEAGVSRRQTISKSLKRLEEHGLARSIPSLDWWKTQEYALLPDSMFDTSDTSLENLLGGKSGTKPNHTEIHSGWGGVYQYGALLCRFRDRLDIGSQYLVRSVGKMSALALAKVVFNGSMTLTELAQSMGRKKSYLKKEYLDRLVEAGLFLEEGGTYTTPANLESVIHAEHDQTGVSYAERLQKEKHSKDRQKWLDGYLDWRVGEPPPEEVRECEPPDLPSSNHLTAVVLTEATTTANRSTYIEGAA